MQSRKFDDIIAELQNQIDRIKYYGEVDFNILESLEVLLKDLKQIRDQQNQDETYE